MNTKDKKCMEYTEEDLFDVGVCPWKITRWSPRKRTMRYLLTFMNSHMNDGDSILEFGCGPSTWFMKHLPLGEYVSCEDFEPAIDAVKKHCTDVNIVNRWVDIPVRKYKWVFVDSKAGSDLTGRWERYLPLTYAHENGLIADDAIMIVHDYNRIKQSLDKPHSVWGKRHKPWNDTMAKYGWNLIDSILISRCFGIYKRNCS